jgi:protein-tyrosine phosphatase
VGEQEALHMVLTRPQGILDDLPPGHLPPLPERPRVPERRPGFWQRLFGTA